MLRYSLPPVMVVNEISISCMDRIVLWLHRETAGCDEDGIADVPVAYSWILLYHEGVWQDMLKGFPYVSIGTPVYSESLANKLPKVLREVECLPWY